MILTPLWFLTFILVTGKIAGKLDDLAWWQVLLPGLLSLIIEIISTTEVIIVDDDESSPS